MYFFKDLKSLAVFVERMDVTFVRLIFWLCIKFSFRVQLQRRILGLQRRMHRPQQEKCNIFEKRWKVQHFLPQTCLTSTQCLGTHHLCLEFNSASFVRREIQKKYFLSAASGQTVSSTKQFVLNSRRISFLGLINMKTFCCCRNMNFLWQIVPGPPPRSCSYLTFWYFEVNNCNMMKAFETFKLETQWRKVSEIGSPRRS